MTGLSYFCRDMRIGTVFTATVLAAGLLALGAGGAVADDDDGIQYGVADLHSTDMVDGDQELSGSFTSSSFLAIN